MLKVPHSYTTNCPGAPALPYFTAHCYVNINVMQYIDVKYSAVQCSHCSAVPCSHCSAVPCSEVKFSAVQCSAVLCSALHCSSVQSNAVQCTAVQCSRPRKDFFLHKQGLIKNYFNHKKCVNFDKSEFASKQRKMYLTTRMSKTRLPHIYGGKNYVNILICSYF